MLIKIDRSQIDHLKLVTKIGRLLSLTVKFGRFHFEYFKRVEMEQHGIGSQKLVAEIDQNWSIRKLSGRFESISLWISIEYHLNLTSPKLVTKIGRFKKLEVNSKSKLSIEIRLIDY